MALAIQATGTTQWFYDADGQPNKMISPQGTILYEYYANTGRLDDLIESVAGPDIATHYVYDDAGQVETVSKFGETTTFVYDAASRPEKMTYASGAYAKYSYDGRSRITAVEHFTSTHSLMRKETNVYDPASRITSRYEGPASGGLTATFGYDDAGQLTSESSSGYSASYTYDANGNRTNRTVNGVSETYTVDDADKLTSVTWSQGGNNYAKEYAYHWSGRPTSITYKTNGGTTATETMTWDKESRMLTNSLVNASYVYNGFDARVSKTVSSTTTTFKRAGADPVSPVVSDVVGSTTTNHLPGISSRTSGTSTFSHSGIKSGILQTNSSQTNTATKRYDAFGNELSTSGTWQTRFDYGGGFGYQRDDESGYKLLGHRYYDSSTGRFLSRDPIKDGRNWYAYCGNNPIAAADLDGLRPTWVYKLFDAFGRFLKNGITRQPAVRESTYVRKFGEGTRLKPIAVYDDEIAENVKYGPQNRQALDHERLLNETAPGPYNRERYLRGKGGRGLLLVIVSILTLDPIGAGEGLAAALEPVAEEGRRTFDGSRRAKTGMSDDELEELTGYRGAR